MADYSAIFEAAGKANNVDPKLLQAVMYRGEMSNGDPRAVSPKGASGLMQLMPDTAKEVGVADVTDPVQNIHGGAKYLSKMLDKYGTVPLALGAYNAGPGAVDKAGGIPNFPETQAYVKRTMSAYQGQTMPKAAPAAPSGDPFLDMANAVQSGKAAAPPLSASAPAANDPFLDMANGVLASKDAGKPAVQTPQQKSVPVTATNVLGATLEPVASLVTGAVAAPIGGAVRLGSAILGNNFEDAKQAGENATNALTYRPQTAGGQAALSDIGGVLGRAKDAVMASPVGNALSAIGNAYNDTFVKGQNPLMATINSQVPTIIANTALPAAGKAAGSVVEGTALNKLRTAIAGEKPPAPGSIPFQTAADKAEAVAAKQAATAAKPKYVPNGDGTFTQVKPATPAGAPKAAAPEPFVAPEMPTPKTNLPAAEQQANIDTMREIGLNTQRQSAYTGDKFTAGQEYQHSKLDSPVGEVVREQLQQEQGAIKNYATNIVKDTGAAAATPEAVGQTVRAPLQGLSEHYDNQVRGLYQAADQQAGGIAGVVPEGFGQLMGTNSMFAGKAENSALRRGINAYMREQGIVDGNGNIQPITVQQAEGMRQYLNSQWSPQNSGLIGKIKESLDMDVAKAGGEDIYAQARALHAERKNTLDNPKGIASLLNESGPDGINKAVPDERIGAKVITMPTAQFQHVVNTLNSLPEHLQPQGAQALAEIKGELAKKIYAAGDSGGTQNGPSMWNAANVTKELNKQASKMALVFSPEEMAKFQTLNRGGHLLQTPSAYPGAAVQGHNLLQRGMIWAPPAAGAALGHAIAGYPGMAMGSALGSSLSGKVARAADVANANKLRGIFADPRPIK